MTAGSPHRQSPRLAPGLSRVLCQDVPQILNCSLLRGFILPSIHLAVPDRSHPVPVSDLG